MGILSSSPGSPGYRSCCVMGTVFLLLAVAEPSSPGARRLGFIPAMPLAMGIPFTLSSLPSLEKEAQRRSCWGRAKRGAETEGSQNGSSSFSVCFQPFLFNLREKKRHWQEERKGAGFCAGRLGVHLDPPRAES